MPLRLLELLEIAATAAVMEIRPAVVFLISDHAVESDLILTEMLAFFKNHQEICMIAI